MELNMRTRSGRKLSRIALGTLYFGTKIPQERCEALIGCFLSMGGNQIDTARSYASWLPGGDGASERAIGVCLKRYQRDDIFLATKGGLMPRGYNKTRGNLGRENIEKDLQESLEMLQTDYIDLYWLHRDDFSHSASEIAEEMDELVRKGVIRYYGVSNWRTDRINEVNAWAQNHGLNGIAASQIQYSLGVCTPVNWGDDSVVCMGREEYESYTRMGMPVYAYSAQAEGYFPVYLKGGSGALLSDTRKKYDSPVNRKRAEAIRVLLREKNISLAWLMAEYVLRSPFMSVFIMGGGNEERMKEIMGFYNVGLSQLEPEEWEAILK